MDFKKVSTKELVDELRKRDGVDGFFIEPSESYEIISGHDLADDAIKAVRNDTGPTTILIVTD